MMPVARLALLRAYPRSELLPVLNFVTMPGLVGPILGPVLGGVLVTWASWHWIFLMNNADPGFLRRFRPIKGGLFTQP